MTLYALKSHFQEWLRPIARSLHSCGVRANHVTLVAAIGSVALGAMLVVFSENLQLFVLLALWQPVRMALNALDGVLACECGDASALGAYLNELGDALSDVALVLPFAFLPGINATLVLGVIGLALLTEFAGILGALVGASRRYDGPLGKSDRAFAVGVLGVLVAFGGTATAISPIVWVSLAVLSIATVIARVRHGLAERLDR